MPPLSALTDVHVDFFLNFLPGGVKAMLDVGYDRPAAQPHAPEDDILQPSISGSDSIPEDRYQAWHMYPAPHRDAVLS